MSTGGGWPAFDQRSRRPPPGSVVQHLGDDRGRRRVDSERLRGVVDPAEDGARRLAAVDRDGPHQRAQLSHERGRFGVVAHHVADDERGDALDGVWNASYQSPPTWAPSRAGDVVAGQLAARRLRHVRGEQAALQAFRPSTSSGRRAGRCRARGRRGAPPRGRTSISILGGHAALGPSCRS